MAKRLYVAWQEPESRAWCTFARLTRLSSDYELVFTQGARRLQTLPSEIFKMDLRQRYRFSELLPIFRNRLPSRSRSDFLRMAHWLNLRGDEAEFDLLSRFGLIPGTDAIMVYPEPDIVDNRYMLEFFVHGIRHMHRDVQEVCAKLSTGDLLLPLLDVQNRVDPQAVAIRPHDQSLLIGYIPTFYAGDVHDLLSRPDVVEHARLTVLRSNVDAPTQLRLLCKFEAPAPSSFMPLQSEAHRLIESAAA